MSAVEEVWYGRGVGPAVARLALRPLSAAFGIVTRARAALYDAGVLSAVAPAVPVLSVGNLTVGGTGKTPVAAFLAARLSRRARTAVALRGYGTDEVEVHARLNPGIPVVVDADRVRAVEEAKRRGAEVVVVDDGFQHRRLRATAHVLLLSVEQLARRERLLPSGPWREPLAAARRADLVLLTRKVASAEMVERSASRVARLGLEVGRVSLLPGPLCRLDAADTLPLASVRGRRVLAIAAIGEPESFGGQLRDAGAAVTLAAFRDHHEFTAAEARELARRVPREGLAVCTLKDAVKLAARWPGPEPLWYLSQQLVVEQGEDAIQRLLERVLDARGSAATFAG